jgi:hypothetical protein
MVDVEGDSVVVDEDEVGRLRLRREVLSPDLHGEEHVCLRVTLLGGCRSCSRHKVGAVGEAWLCWSSGPKPDSAARCIWRDSVGGIQLQRTA